MLVVVTVDEMVNQLNLLLYDVFVHFCWSEIRRLHLHLGNNLIAVFSAMQYVTLQRIDIVNSDLIFCGDVCMYA